MKGAEYLQGQGGGYRGQGVPEGSYRWRRKTQSRAEPLLGGILQDALWSTSHSRTRTFGEFCGAQHLPAESATMGSVREPYGDRSVKQPLCSPSVTCCRAPSL